MVRSAGPWLCNRSHSRHPLRRRRRAAPRRKPTRRSQKRLPRFRPYTAGISHGRPRRPKKATQVYTPAPVIPKPPPNDQIPSKVRQAQKKYEKAKAKAPRRNPQRAAGGAISEAAQTVDVQRHHNVTLHANLQVSKNRMR